MYISLPSFLLLVIPVLVGCLPVWLPISQPKMERSIDSNTLPLRLRWEYRIGDLLDSKLLFQDNLLYVPQGSVVHTLNIETGDRIWSFTNNHKVSQELPPPALSEDILVLYTIESPSSAEINVLTATSGKLRWTRPAETVYSFAIDSEKLYVGLPGHVRASHLVDGSLAWEMARGLPDHTIFHIYYDLGKVYIVSYNHVYVLDSVSGQLLKSFEKSESSFELVSQGILYCSTRNSVLAVNTSSGEIVWQNQIWPDNFYIGPILLRGVLYVPTYAGELVAIDPGTGLQKWRTMNMGRPLSNIVLLNNRGYFISQDAMLHGFDPTTGAELGTLVTTPHELAKYPSGRPATPSLVVTDHILIATFGDVIYGFEDALQ